MSSTPKHSAAYLDEPKAGRLTIQYAPDNGVEVIENPPRFMWLPVVEDEAHYVIRLSRSASFEPADTLVYPNIPLNFYTPDAVIDAGDYYWSYAVWDESQQAAATAWSSVREFTMSEDSATMPLI